MQQGRKPDSLSESLDDDDQSVPDLWGPEVTEIVESGEPEVFWEPELDEVIEFLKRAECNPSFPARYWQQACALTNTFQWPRWTREAKEAFLDLYLPAIQDDEKINDIIRKHKAMYGGTQPKIRLARTAVLCVGWAIWNHLTFELE